MNKGIKRCPFCGSELVKVLNFDNRDDFVCFECNAHVNFGTSDINEAIPAWNRREYSWDMLMEILDEVYPADVFNGSSNDIAPRIIMNLREIDLLRQEAKEAGNGKI